MALRIWSVGSSPRSSCTVSRSRKAILFSEPRGKAGCREGCLFHRRRCGILLAAGRGTNVGGVRGSARRSRGDSLCGTAQSQLHDAARAPSRDGIWVTDAYVGTAHAMRRDIFLQLGGYRESLFHQGEESDFCIRMLDAGYVVRAGNADVVCHYESPRRDFRRMDIYGRRNDILFAWHNVPARLLPLHLAGTTFNGLRWGLGTKRLANMIRGLLRGYLASARYATCRRPVREIPTDSSAA